MWNHNLKLAFRNLWRHKTFSFINLSGLTIGLAINIWLQDFAFRIDISWMIFIIAGLASVSIALITISFQAIKAAMANPVKSLRTE